MKLLEYLKDKILIITMSVLTFIFIGLILIMFNINNLITFLILIVLFINFFIIIFYDYFKRKNFYNNFKKTLYKLDKKYLITEMINKSNFLEGNLILEYLRDLNKNMHEEINNYKYKSNEFKEYLELWCHEIKIPLSTSKLIVENNKSDVNISILEELDKIEEYVEQVLYYSKSDTLEEDYIVTNTYLKDVVDKVIKKNKKNLIGKKIKVNITINSKLNIESDPKWLEFIVNQILINSIKYSKDNNAEINVYNIINKNNIMLMIEDNGIGINETELSKVFDKGFTGTNGRKKYKSTGIGLYLCKKLCIKLGHNINIYSIQNEKTIVTIIFPTNSMMNVIK